MKGQGRSHRPSSSEPDDWGDGSWIVDCACGVNFDDGEEMVSCDECGVWVHTRCSRFVKGETSFACDKCKIKKRRKEEENEETEVAQLLAELPTKTLRMDSCRASSFRMASEFPMEDRVHVQGIPGGDPALFEGSGTVFSRELWKCSGYVPKKLNFQYREFPCWDDKENIDVVPFLQSKMQIDNQAVVLDDDSRGLEERERVAVSEGRRGEDTEREISVPASSKEKSVLHQGSESRGEDRHSSPRGEGRRRLEGKNHKHQHHHHHHHGHHQGKRKKEEGGSSRDNAGKKRAKTSGDKDRDENLKKKGSSSQDGGHTSRGLRSAPKNPKSMRNLAAQRFLDDGLKAHSGSCKVEPNELACHDSLFGGSHDKTEVHDCENGGAPSKVSSLDKREVKNDKREIKNDKREIKNEEYRETLLQDSEQDGIFKKHETQRNMEKLKLASAPRINSTEIPSDSFICTMSSEPYLKKDCQITGKAGNFSPTRESMKFHIEASKNATALIKQEDLKIAVEDASMSNAGKSTVDFESSEDPVVHAELAPASELASPKSFSGNCPQVDAVPCVSITSPTFNGVVASESAISLLKVKSEVNDELAMLDVKPLPCSNSNLTREKYLGEGCKQPPQKAEEPFAYSQPRHLAVSGNSFFKQATHHSGPVAKSSRPDECMQSQRQQTLAQNQPEDNCQVAKDIEDFHVENRDNMTGIELKSGLDVLKQILPEDSHCQDDAVSEERRLKLEQSFHGGYEQAQSSPQQSSILLQEARLPPAHRPRFSMGSSLYTASAIGLSMQVSSSKSPNGSSKSNPGAAQLHKNGIGGVGRTPGSSSVSRPPTSGPIAESNNKSSGQGVKSSVYTSSPATKPIHPSKQRFRSGNSTEVMKDDAGNVVSKGASTGSPRRVSPEISSLKSVPKDNVKCLTNSTGKTAPPGKSSFPGGASKQAASSPKGHSSCPSSKSSAGQNAPIYSSSTEHVVAMHQHTSSMQTKHATIGTVPKNEKSSLPAAQSVLKGPTALPLAHPQVSNNVPTTLSDEALALLLHQELNSSPRVPRVPRVRHAGNIPQMASSSTPPSCTFVKRPTVVTPQCNSVGGQKDHNLVSRKRNREDSAKESSRTVQGIDEPVKPLGLLSSPDTRRLEESNRADDLSYSTRRETPSRSSDISCAANKNVASTSVHNTTEGSSHSIAFDSIDGHLSSVHASPGDLSDDAENTLIGGSALTLPSLIDEILNKNQQMSYDELCEVVLPHWQNLRKHNGERYAYTSHCQAVLDCLRNRAVWAHLVDRGPKTGMGRKKRRIDAAVAVDSENDEEADGIGSIDEDELHTGRLSKLHNVGSERSDSLASNRQKDIDITAIEDVPKGKRKARRRPPACKSREDMDEFKRSNKKDKQRYKTEGLVRTPQQEEQEPFSASSEDTSSNDSEDDNHNVTHSVRMCLASSDTSADDLESTP